MPIGPGVADGDRAIAAGRVFAPVAQAERVAMGLTDDHSPPFIPPAIRRKSVEQLGEFLLGRAEARARRAGLAKRERDRPAEEEWSAIGTQAVQLADEPPTAVALTLWVELVGLGGHVWPEVEVEPPDHRNPGLACECDRAVEAHAQPQRSPAGLFDELRRDAEPDSPPGLRRFEAAAAELGKRCARPRDGEALRARGVG